MKSHWSKLFFPIFFVIILFMVLVKYISFHTTFWDLGWQDYIVYNIIPGQSWQFLFRGHAHIFSLFYSFLYKFLPSPVLLITCQILAIVGAGLLVSGQWTVDGGQKSNRLQTILIILYLLYFPVWYNCLFDFHFEHLFVLFCAIFYWLVIGQWSVDSRQKPNRLPSKTLVFLICVLCCLVKEVFALSAIMMGVYVIVRRRWLVCGLLIVLFSCLYFIFVECYAIPYFTAGKEAPAIWHSAFGYLGSNMKEVFLNLLTHPWLLITETLSDWRKLLYIIAIFGPFLFIPFLSPLELLPALPQFFISLLSHNPNHYALSSQYTAGLIVPVFVAFIKGLPRAGRLWRVVKDLESCQLSVVSGQRFGQWSMDGRQKKIDYQPQAIEKKEGVKNGEEQVRKSGGMAVGNGVSKRYIANFKIFPQRGDVWNNFSVQACSNIYFFKYCRGFWQRIRQSFFTISLPSKREFNGSKDIDFNLQGDCNITTREGEKFNKRNRHITPKIKLPYNLSSTIDHPLPTTNYQLLTIILLVSIFFHILLSPSPISPFDIRCSGKSTYDTQWNYSWITENLGHVPIKLYLFKNREFYKLLSKLGIGYIALHGDQNQKFYRKTKRDIERYTTILYDKKFWLLGKINNEIEDDFTIYLGSILFSDQDISKMLPFLKLESVVFTKSFKNLTSFKNLNASNQLFTIFPIIKQKGWIYKEKKINPTKYIVKLNAISSFLLVFKQTYDPNWQAIVLKDTKQLEVVHSRHVYSVINGFWIDQTGDLEIVIRYKPQDWFEIGLVISALTFIGCIGYLIYDWRKNKKLVVSDRGDASVGQRKKVGCSL